MAVIRNRIQRLALTIAFSWILYVITFPRRAINDNNQDESPRVLIVIGIRNSPGNLALRVRTAAESASQFSDLILSGGAPDTGELSEAQQMHDLWLKYSRRSESMYKTKNNFHLEEDSQSTTQNAFYSLPILQKIVNYHRGVPFSSINRITVVTNDFHAARTKLLFEQVFLTYDMGDIQVDILAAPTDWKDRQDLFQKESRFMSKTNLDWLLLNMTGHPFRLPSEYRIQEARSDLEKYRILNQR